MFIPEYTITNKVLQNIALIEYVKAVADQSVILKSWEKNLQKQEQTYFIKKNLELEGIKISLEEIKKYVDGLSPFPAGIVLGIKKSLDITQTLAQSYEIEEEDIITMYGAVTGLNENSLKLYREKKTPSSSEKIEKNLV